VLEQLRELKRRFLGPTDDRLAEKLGRRRQIGGVDEAFTRKGTFTTSGEQQADAISAAVQARLDRTLATLQKASEVQSKVGTSRPMRRRAPEELKELVTKKLK
jgi:hypothetical protein